MSEESSSTPLRLKPKLRVEADGASAASASVPESAPDAVAGKAGAEVEGDANQRLRLKPRLAPADSGEPNVSGPAAPAEASPSSGAEPKMRLKPRLSTESETPSATGSAPVAHGAVPPPLAPAVDAPPAIVEQPAPPAMIGGFKLKPKAASEEPPPLPAAEAIGKGAPEPAGVAGADEAPPPPKFRVKPSPDVVKSFDETSKVTPMATEAKRRSPVLVLVLLVVLLGGGGYYGYYGYRTFLAPAGEASSESEAAAADGPASLAGQLVDKARDAAAAQAGRFDGMEDLGVEARSPAAATPSPAAADGVMAAMPPRVEEPAPPPEPSAAFTRFVTEMRISGVFQGDPPRALINGRTIRAGEPIDIGLGIVFTGIDVDRRLILMREASGAMAAKKY